MSTTEIPVDIDVLREEIRKTYTDVSIDHDAEFIFPTGRWWAEELGYPVVVKTAVPGAHKTETGGSALGLTTPDEVRKAAARIGLPVKSGRRPLQHLDPFKTKDFDPGNGEGGDVHGKPQAVEISVRLAAP